MKRRDFFKVGLLQAAVVTTPLTLKAAPLNPKRRHTPSVLQGATDEIKTQFSILYDATKVLDFIAVDNHGRLHKPDRIERINPIEHPKAITKTFFSNLDPACSYYLHILNAYNGSLIETREFRTLKNKARLKFAICSCMDERFHEPKIWQDVIAQDPDLLFFVGDTVYADRGALGGADPKHLWKRFSDSRETLEIYFSRKLVPILATWDDHDFGKNDAGADYHFIPESQQNFLNFFAQDESHCKYLVRGEGVASSYSIGSHLFILFDDRSFRAPSGTQELYGQWGEAQEKWAYELVRAHSGQVWLINGSQFFPSFAWQDSFSRQYRNNFKNFVGNLRKLQKKTIFISGDVHYTELTAIPKEVLGYETLEITSSPVHSVVIPGFPAIVPNRARIAGCGKRNYVLIEAVSNGVETRLDVSCRSSQGRLNFSQSFLL